MKAKVSLVDIAIYVVIVGLLRQSPLAVIARQFGRASAPPVARRNTARRFARLASDAIH